MSNATPTNIDQLELWPAKFEIATTLEWEDWKHVVLPRLEASSKLEIPHLRELPAHKGHAIIAGAGPSLELFDPVTITPLTTIFSLNGAHQWLLDRNIFPNIHVMFEHDVEEVSTALGGSPNSDVVYYLSSHCHPFVFSQLESYRRVLWHANIPLQEYHEAIARHFPGEFMVSGGYATFFKTLTIALLLGYRNFDLFGVDSSFEKNSHLDGYATSNVEEQIKVWGTNPNDGTMRQFTSHGGLAFQANEFIKFCNQYHKDIRLRVHGDSLIRYLHETRYPEQY